jgi:hypothetical protein
MPTHESHPSIAVDTRHRADLLLKKAVEQVHRQTDRQFVLLLGIQWLVAIGLALWLSPRAWANSSDGFRPFLLGAMLVGGAILALPTWLAV